MAGTLAGEAGCAVAGDKISVTLCQAAASYQATLPAALARAGMLQRVVRVSPELQILEPSEVAGLKLVKQFPLYKAFKQLLWSAWGLGARGGRPQLPIVATSWLAGHLVARWVPRTGIFHALPGLALPCLQQPGITFKSVLENATLHPRGWQREVLYECAQAGISRGACSSELPARLIRRLEEEYELCDAIVVPSTIARRSFAEFGLAGKTHVVWPGVNSEFFAPRGGPPPSPIFRACFVGRIELAKGILYLLEAWKRLALPGAELVLVGPVQPDIQTILHRYSGSNIILTGALSRREVADRYRCATVFIHPSPSEGLGLVLLEAMACGVPVIATDRSGAEDCITHGKDGFVVPARDVPALAEAISWCFRHRGDLPAVGFAARQKIARRFTLTHYEQRQIAFYRSLAAGIVPSSATQPAATLS